MTNRCRTPELFACYIVYDYVLAKAEEGENEVRRASITVVVCQGVVVCQRVISFVVRSGSSSSSS